MAAHFKEDTMKKKLLIAVLALALVFPALVVTAELLNITTAGVDGNWVIYDANKNIIATFDAANRKITIPSGSNITVSSGGTATFTGATLTGGTFASQTLTGATITSPTVTGIDTTYNVSTHEYTTDADWAMSATEAKSILLSVSSGSGALNIIGPDVSGRLYVVRNGSAGAVGSVTLKKSGGTGITVASGKTAILMHNGSDYIRVTADGTH